MLGTMAHILGSEQLWLSRFLGIPLGHVPSIDDYPTLAALAVSYEDFWPQLEFFLASLAEQLDQDFTWTNLAGETHTAPFRQVLLHFVNHATYHRGQVVSLLRQLGYIPPHTDLVYFRGALTRAARVAAALLVALAFSACPAPQRAAQSARLLGPASVPEVTWPADVVLPESGLRAGEDLATFDPPDRPT